jgi:hypothetical protein
MLDDVGHEDGLTVHAGFREGLVQESSSRSDERLSLEILVIAGLFACLFPRLLISTTDSAYTLTVGNSTASSYSLQVMTIVAAVMVPLILLYQGWTYYVFRARVVGPSRTADDKVGNDVTGG